MKQKHLKTDISYYDISDFGGRKINNCKASPVKDGTKASQRIGERILVKLFNCQFVADFAVVLEAKKCTEAVVAMKAKERKEKAIVAWKKQKEGRQKWAETVAAVGENKTLLFI